MGVNLKDLLIRKPIKIEELSGKTLVVDGYNILYQFLTTIRSRDGSVLTNHNGEVTSHLIGLFSRTTALMQKNIRLVFVFDGAVPELKHLELSKRAEAKKEAEARYQEALAINDTANMFKFAGRTARLTKEMVGQAKTLLSFLGIPWIQAPSEGEAQAAFMVKKGDAWAVVSQDYDSLLFGTPRLIQNLSIEGRRKVPGKLAFKTVEPVLVELKENLTALELSQEQLIWLSMLVGTDYAPGGVKGVGPKKGLALVKTHSSAQSLFSSLQVDFAWSDVLDVFKKMPVLEEYKLSWTKIDRLKIIDFLVKQHDFNLERVEKTLDALAPKPQSKLGDF